MSHINKDVRKWAVVGYGKLIKPLCAGVTKLRNVHSMK